MAFGSGKTSRLHGRWSLGTAMRRRGERVLSSVERVSIDDVDVAKNDTMHCLK